MTGLVSMLSCILVLCSGSSREGCSAASRNSCCRRWGLTRHCRGRAASSRGTRGSGAVQAAPGGRREHGRVQSHAASLAGSAQQCGRGPFPAAWPTARVAAAAAAAPSKHGAAAVGAAARHASGAAVLWLAAGGLASTTTVAHARSAATCDGQRLCTAFRRAWRRSESCCRQQWRAQHIGAIR